MAEFLIGDCVPKSFERERVGENRIQIKIYKG